VQEKVNSVSSALNVPSQTPVAVVGVGGMVFDPSSSAENLVCAEALAAATATIKTLKTFSVVRMVCAPER
jgi:hypothetical protein